MAPSALIPWLDPEVIITTAGPWALVVVCFIVFAETGLLVTLTTMAGRTANAASILEVLSLGVGCGDIVTITAHGDGADAALGLLVEVLSTDFDTT